jgi:SAM-dependent methyltransferase
MRTLDAHVAWHDVECGSYDADLAIWRGLAARHAAGMPVLDVGAGSGRVALDLARDGHPVLALDTDAALLAALRDRAGDLAIETVVADARSFALGRTFGLVIAPMQTVQLLGGADGRAAFLAAARAHLRPGGVLAAAIAHPLIAFDPADVILPEPDVGTVGDVRLASHAVAIRDEGDRVALVRVREATWADGEVTREENVIHLDRLDSETLAAEGAAAGLHPQSPLHIPASEDYVDSTVVVWRG